MTFFLFSKGCYEKSCLVSSGREHRSEEHNSVYKYPLDGAEAGEADHVSRTQASHQYLESGHGGSLTTGPSALQSDVSRPLGAT